MRLTTVTASLVAASIMLTLAPSVHADPDTDFATELHAQGIYGPRDYNAWVGKITCKRLATGVDSNAFESAKFISNNLARGTTTEQSWQFLSAGMRTYCPEQLPALAAAVDPQD